MKNLIDNEQQLEVDQVILDFQAYCRTLNEAEQAIMASSMMRAHALFFAHLADELRPYSSFISSVAYNAGFEISDIIKEADKQLSFEV